MINRKYKMYTMNNVYKLNGIPNDISMKKFCQEDNMIYTILIKIFLFFDPYTLIFCPDPLDNIRNNGIP